MRSHEDGFSEIIDEILIVSIVLILGAVIFVMVFGVIPQLPKSAYMTADVSVKQMPGYSAIAMRQRAGDTLNFTGGSELSYTALVYIDTPGGSYQAVPTQAVGEFGPGDLVYLYYTGSGYSLVPSLNGVTANPQPSEDLRVRIMDPVSNLLIFEWKSPKYGTTKTTTATPTTAVPTTNTTPVIANVTTPVTPTTTIIPTATVTANATTTTTTTLTNNATPTATVTPLAPMTTAISFGPVISVSWSPPGLGTISPPGITPGTVTVPDGTSQIFTITPKSQKSVLSIHVDGSLVSSGGSVGQTLTYTLTNVQGPHTLTATFG